MYINFTTSDESGLFHQESYFKRESKDELDVLNLTFLETTK